jgi:FtsZ-binding cell division protein ZapB
MSGKNSLATYDKLEKKTTQAIALIKLISSDDEIGNMDSRLINQSLWAIADMFIEIQTLQQSLFSANK